MNWKCNNKSNLAKMSFFYKNISMLHLLGGSDMQHVYLYISVQVQGVHYFFKLLFNSFLSHRIIDSFLRIFLKMMRIKPGLLYPRG